MHHNPTRRCAQLDVGCAVGPTQRPCSKAHLAAVIVDDALLAILLNADAVPAYLPESSLPDPPSLTGPPCPLNDRNSQDSRLPSMVAGNSHPCRVNAHVVRIAASATHRCPLVSARNPRPPSSCHTGMRLNKFIHAADAPIAVRLSSRAPAPAIEK